MEVHGHEVLGYPVMCWEVGSVFSVLSHLDIRSLEAYNLVRAGCTFLAVWHILGVAGACGWFYRPVCNISLAVINSTVLDGGQFSIVRRAPGWQSLNCS